MVLQRNIIYVLFGIWCLSFVGLFSTYEVIENISSGLLSGALIGILTSITQYYKAKTEFFQELFNILKDYYRVFIVDEELTCKSITFLREHSWDEVNACEGFKDFDEVNNDIIQRYSSLPSTFNYEDYVPLNPFDKRSSKLIESIEFEISFARGEAIKFHDELFDVKNTQTESDLEDCLYSRTILYSALASAIQCTYSVTQKIANRFKLHTTKEYKYWLQYADDVYFASLENQEYLLYGEISDDECDEVYEEDEVLI